MISYLKSLFGLNTKSDLAHGYNENNMLPKRIELIDKFFRNLQAVEDLKVAMDMYCDITGSWDLQMFPDSKVTHLEYFITLNQISEVEYGESQCEAIRNSFIHEGVLDEYIIRIDSQYNNLKVIIDHFNNLEQRHILSKL